MEKFLMSYMPVDASAHGAALDRILIYTHWLMLFLFLGWGLYFIYVLYRFRASRNPKADYQGTRSHISTYSEVAVAIIEAVLLIGFSIPAWARWVAPHRKALNPLEIRVVSEQFAWNIHYPGPDKRFGRTDVKLVSSSNALGLDLRDPYAKDDVVTINQLHLEVNRPVSIQLSAKDVIHSFGLPVMRVKQDAIPGMVMPVTFTPVKVNNGAKWEIACAQLCGLGHYRMRGELNVQSKRDFDLWLAKNAPAPDTQVPPPAPPPVEAAPAAHGADPAAHGA